MYRFYVNIGDWSGDGHGKADRYLFESSYPVEELQAAYKKSIKLTGIKLHTIASDYDDCTVPEDDAKKLLDHGLPEYLIRAGHAEEFWEEMGEYRVLEKDFAQIIMWFAGLSMPEDCVIRAVDEEITNFNGFWGDLNISFGYGCYY